METGFLHLHSLLRWAALFTLVVAIIRSITGIRNERAYTKADNRWAFFTLLFFHFQLLVGLVLYFNQGWHLQFDQMGEKLIRFYAVEHLVAMLIAITLVTIGRIRSKKAGSDILKFRRQFWPFLIALLIVLLNIPWPFTEVGAGRSWFPGL